MPNETTALVLLSGGIGSVGALRAALDPVSGYSAVQAFSVDYGQINRDQELSAAQQVAQRCGVPWARAILPGLPRVTATGAQAGVFVPGLAGLLLWRAAAHAAMLWSDGTAHLIYGCTLDNAAAAACRGPFIEDTSLSILRGLSGVLAIGVKAPWIQRGWRRSDILQWASTRPDALTDIRASVSCGSKTRCGECEICLARAAAFCVAGIDDGAPVYLTSGGDPAREAKFK